MVGDYELDQGMNALEVLDEHLNEQRRFDGPLGLEPFDSVELLDEPVRLGVVLLLLLYWLEWLVF